MYALWDKNIGACSLTFECKEAPSRRASNPIVDVFSE